MYSWRFNRYCLMLLGVLLLLTLSSTAQTRHHARVSKAAMAATQADVSSGFIPGSIDIFAGNGNDTATVSGSIATSTGIYGGPLAIASDSLGDVVFSQSSATRTAIYMVYAGGGIPQTLAAVTTQASPAVTPVKGYIYEIDCGCKTVGTTLSQTGVNASALWFDSSDNLYIADATVYYSAFKVDHTTGNITRIAGVLGTKGSYSSGDTISGVATSVPLHLSDVKTDAYGNVYISDSTDFVVLVVYSGSQAPPVLAAEGVTNPTFGNIYTIAGQVGNSCYFNWDYSTTVNTYYICAQSGAASGSSPYVLGNANSIAVDASGNVYILDGAMLMVDVISAGIATPPLLTAEGTTPVAGNIYAIVGYNNPNNLAANYLYGGCDDSSPCNDGTANDLWFDTPHAIAVDTSGDVYVSDRGEHAVLKIDAVGYASTVAGIDDPYQSIPATATIATDKSATDTSLSAPTGIAFDPSDNLYVADAGYYTVWQASPALAQTITFPTLTTPVTYGVNQISLGATATSGLDVAYSVSSTSPATVSGSGSSAVLNVTGAGTIAVTAAQAGGTSTAGIYAAATSVTQDVTVSNASLAVTADSLHMIYGASVPTLTYNTSGWVSSADQSSSTVVTGTPTLSTTATSTKDSGTYPITIDCSSMSSSDYTFTCVNGTMTITGATAQSITFPAFSAVTYGHAAITLGASASSKLPVTYTVVSGPGTVSGSTLTITGAGTIVVQASQNGNDTYAGATPHTQSLNVNPAPLTLTAPSPTYPYGTNITTALAATSPTITGWVGTDTSVVVSGSPAYTTSATSTSDPGSFTLSVAQGQLALASSAAANYTFTTFNSSTITITKASQTISYVAPTKITYGDLLTITATSNAGLPVTGTITGNLTAISSVTVPSSKNYTLEWNAAGVGTATINLTQAGTTDYAAATPVVLSFNVGQAPLDITAISMTRERGASNPTFTYTVGTSAAGTVGGFVNSDTDIPSVVSGVPTLTTTATQASSPGTYTIAVDTSTMTSANYYFVPITGTLTVTQAGTYTITANPSSLTIARGQSAQSTIIITPSNAYQGTIALTCGTLPANVTCTISPSTYTFTGAYNSSGYEYPAQGIITINTTSATVVGNNAPRKSNVSFAGFLIPGSLTGLFLVFARKRVAKITIFWSLYALLALGIGATLGLTSCGGSSVNTTAAAGTQTITITGSGTTPSGSGTVTATVPLTITIQ
jgi:hypothetical protein